MVLQGVHLTQGLRLFLSSLQTKIKPQRYDGNAKEICQQIVKDCWNKRYFQTSNGHFSQFWTRDFGWSVQSLLKLGYEQQVHQTLRYALNRFREANMITTAITAKGQPFDFPVPAVDSLPWLVHTIRVSTFPYHTHRAFLNKEIAQFFQQFIDPNTGLVKPDITPSSIKDYAQRKSSCYDNCLVGLLAKDLAKMKLDNPFKDFNYPDLIIRHFWQGAYFYDDLQQKDYVAGDANLFPFVLGLIGDEAKLKAALQSIHQAGLDEPFPLKYTHSRVGVSFVWQEIFARDYESNAIWAHMGPLYIKLLKAVDPVRAAEYKNRYTRLIERYHNFIEVYNIDCVPYQSGFYAADQGLLWAANYLTL